MCDRARAVPAAAGLYNIKVAFSGASGEGVANSIYLSAASDWEETSDAYAAHCASASSMPTTSDCRTNCLNPTGWPKGTGFWLQQDGISIDLVRVRACRGTSERVRVRVCGHAL